MIRAATRDDIRELAELWARAFPGLRTVEDRIAALETGGVYGGVETCWIAEDAGRTVGAFRGYRLRQHMHGATLGMMGLAAVAVDETYRRRGLGRRLCEVAIRAGRERGDVLSVLYPFRPAWYEALGWGSTGALHAFRFRPESLRSYEPAGAIRRATPADLDDVAAVYRRFAEAANGPIRRTRRIWDQQLSGDTVQVYVAGDTHATGYAVLRLGRTASPEDRPVYVRELVADDHRALEGLLGWICEQQDAWRVVHYDAAPDEHFAHRLHDPRTPGFSPHRHGWAPAARLVGGPMLRLLDVTQALQARLRWGPAAPLRFGIEVRDSIVPENDGEFVVEYDGGRATVTRGSARPLLRLPVSVLAQVYAGELRVADALMLGRATHDGDLAAVDSLFRTDRCFRLLDEF